MKNKDKTKEELIEELKNLRKQVTELERTKKSSSFQRGIERSDELEVLTEISNLVNKSLNLDQILSVSLDKVLELMNLESGYIRLLEEEDELSLVVSRNMPPSHSEKKQKVKLQEGFPGEAVQKEEPIVIEDIQKEERTKDLIVKEAGFSSMAYFPLFSEEKISGVL